MRITQHFPWRMQIRALLPFQRAAKMKRKNHKPPLPPPFCQGKKISCCGGKLKCKWEQSSFHKSLTPPSCPNLSRPTLYYFSSVQTLKIPTGVSILKWQRRSTQTISSSAVLPLPFCSCSSYLPGLNTRRAYKYPNHIQWML